jgi:3-oxoacyl-[acyl-carrier protein] reductase
MTGSDRRAAELSELSRSIEGRVAVVTGAASGMGRATARLFAGEGARVAACDLDGDRVEAVAADIRSAGGDATPFAFDLADAQAIATAAAEIRSALGPVDILVNNAGMVGLGPIGGDGFEDVWHHTFDVNLHAHMHLIRAFLDDLTRDGEGRIVNISSTEGLGGSADNTPYGASKHGVIGLTKSLAVELGRTGVTVNAVCPGPIHTGMTELIPEGDKATFAHRRTALRRYGDPEEVAHMTLALCLPSASYVTGVALPVDGGMRARNN